MSDATPTIPLISPEAALGDDTPLVEVLDRLLDHGVALRGEIWLTVADVDLVFVGADLVLASPDRITRAGVPPTTAGDGPFAKLNMEDPQ